MKQHSERIELVAPLSGDFQAVVRLIIGGIAERVDFAFEEIDDVSLTFEIVEGGIRARVGPLNTNAIADALADGVAPPGVLTLRRILQTVVDSFGVETADDGRAVVRLVKHKGVS